MKYSTVSDQNNIQPIIHILLISLQKTRGKSEGWAVALDAAARGCLVIFHPMFYKQKTKDYTPAKKLFTHQTDFPSI